MNIAPNKTTATTGIINAKDFLLTVIVLLLTADGLGVWPPGDYLLSPRLADDISIYDNIHKHL